METKIETNKIYIEDNNEILAEITFPNYLDGVIIDHTFVSEKLRGQGIAEKLMTEVYEEIKRTNRKAYLSCSYAIKYFEKHPEKRDILK